MSLAERNLKGTSEMKLIYAETGMTVAFEDASGRAYTGSIVALHRDRATVAVQGDMHDLPVTYLTALD